jgi:4-hydroxy-tetrahydrodipicolinate reductase
VSAIRVCVPGARGRMGRHVIDQMREHPQRFRLTAALEHAGHDDLGMDVGGVALTCDLDAAMASAQVYIDFSVPKGTLACARAAGKTGTAAVIGTTGLGKKERAAIDDLARTAPVVLAPNFSLGVNVLLVLAEKAAAALGDSFDLEVVEAHHKNKRDAPSGTAIALADALARGRGWQLDDVKQFTRDGDVGPRPERQIGVATVRGGDVAGDHTAFFLGPHERIELTHRAGSRSIFAAGAVRAAEWLVSKEPGLYSMRDVLGL